MTQKHSHGAEQPNQANVILLSRWQDHAEAGLLSSPPMVTLKLGQRSLCNSSEAEMSHCFGCPIFSTGHNGLVMGLSPSTL